jgi:hypothetical protein
MVHHSTRRLERGPGEGQPRRFRRSGPARLEKCSATNRARARSLSAEVTDEVVDFWISCFRNPKFSPSFRAEMADKLMDRVYG